MTCQCQIRRDCRRQAVLLEHLGEWQSVVDLTQPRYLTIIDEAIRTGDKPNELRALRTLVRENYGLPLYEEVKRAKVCLNDARLTTISMNVPGIQFTDQIERWDFERLIGPDVREVAACVDRAVAAAGLHHTDINVVLRTGGSSRIPRYVRMLAEKCGAAQLQEMDVFTGVASGLAIAAGEERALERLDESGDRAWTSRSPWANQFAGSMDSASCIEHLPLMEDVSVEGITQSQLMGQFIGRQYQRREGG